MTKKTLNAQIEQLLEGLDSQEVIAEATKLLHKRFFEKSKSAELDNRLDYTKHQASADGNSCNGSTMYVLSSTSTVLWLNYAR